MIRFPTGFERFSFLLACAAGCVAGGFDFALGSLLPLPFAFVGRVPPEMFFFERGAVLHFFHSVGHFDHLGGGEVVR